MLESERLLAAEPSPLLLQLQDDDDDDDDDEGEDKFIQLEPRDRVVQFQQVSWNLDRVTLENSSWGQLKVNPNALKRNTGKESGYLNVFLHSERSSQPLWLVDNLFVAPPARRSKHRQPVCRYFDLQLGGDIETGREPDIGRVHSLWATVLFTAQALPVSEELVDVARRFSPFRFRVRSVRENTEGFGPHPSLGTRPPVRINPRFPLGLPPPPLTVPSGPITDLFFPICIFQNDAPNIECAKNQCVPMAEANTIQFLEDEYNGFPLAWNLPELPIPGIGQQTLFGDIIGWVPVPENSLVANVDFFTRRNGVFDFESGSGANICQLFRGLFGYLTLAGPFTNASFLHLGTDLPVIGDGAACDTITIDLGGRVSNREGLAPTFEWMFEQLTLGRGVAICFGRYDVDGNRTSGHCVRVWVACRFGFTKYLHTLDDGNQGANSVGTRTQEWVVEDTGGPGQPGVPDGLLNMDGMSWEIEFANSIQAHPTLLIP